MTKPTREEVELWKYESAHSPLHDHAYENHNRLICLADAYLAQEEELVNERLRRKQEYWEGRHSMINWNEVKVGETEICRPSFTNRKVVGVFDDWVWLKDLSGYPCSYYKKDLTYWAIYDPWEEITEECEWRPIKHSQYDWGVYYKNTIISRNDPQFKFNDNGRRVWKRKEG